MFYFATDDGRYFAERGDILCDLVSHPNDATLYATPQAAEAAFLRLPKSARQGIYGRAYDASSPRLLAAA